MFSFLTYACVYTYSHLYIHLNLDSACERKHGICLLEFGLFCFHNDVMLYPFPRGGGIAPVFFIVTDNVVCMNHISYLKIYLFVLLNLASTCVFFSSHIFPSSSPHFHLILHQMKSPVLLKTHSHFLVCHVPFCTVPHFRS